MIKPQQVNITEDHSGLATERFQSLSGGELDSFPLTILLTVIVSKAASQKTWNSTNLDPFPGAGFVPNLFVLLKGTLFLPRCRQGLAHLSGPAPLSPRQTEPPWETPSVRAQGLQRRMGPPPPRRERPWAC